jgi:hypothetical protein
VILKKMDDKQDQLSYLKERLNHTTNDYEKQKIQHEMNMIKNGSYAEKGNAYYLDFDFKDSDKFIVLHDIRIEHKGRTAQIDHIVISRSGIHILESKSVKNGTLKINDDDSIEIQYSKYKKITLPSPIEQNRRHKKVIEDFIYDTVDLPFNLKTLGGINIETLVLIHPHTNVYNYKLPKGYIKADQFRKYFNEDVDNSSALDLMKFVVKFLNHDIRMKIAHALIAAHKPIDYNFKAKITSTKICDNNRTCPRCKKGTLVKRTRKNKKYDDKYKSSEFLGCNQYPRCRYAEEIVSH